VRGQGIEEVRTNETIHPRGSLSLQVVFNDTKNREAGLLDIAFGIREFEDHRIRTWNTEFVEEVVQHGAITRQNLTTQRTETQKLQRDGVFVAHGFQMGRHDAGHRLHLGFRSEGANALHLLGQDHIVVRNVRDAERTHRTFATLTDGTWRTWGQQG